METILKIGEKLLDFLIWIFKNRRKKAGDAFVDFAEINAIVKEWVHGSDLNIERVCIMKAHNGQVGKKLMPAGYKYSSIIANDWRAPFVDVRERYQNVLQDNEYVALVAETYLKREVDVYTNRLENCALLNMYRGEKVEFAKWFFIGHNKEELWFMTIATSQPGVHFDSDLCETALYLGVNRIREIVKGYMQ